MRSTRDIAQPLNPPGKSQSRGMAAAQELFGFSSQQIAEVNVQIKVKLQESEQFLGLDGPDPVDPSSPKNSVGQVQKSIRQAVKNSALLGNVIKNILAAKNAKVLIHELKQAIWVMFDVKDIILFLVDVQGQTLVEQVS